MRSSGFIFKAGPKGASCLACPMIAKRIPSPGYTPLRFAALRPWTSETLFLLRVGARFVRKGAEMDHQIIATWARVGVGVGQLVLIGWGLWQMSQSGKRRDRQLDVMTKALTQQGEVLAELLRRSA